jgi:hypothetical protein
MGGLRGAGRDLSIDSPGGERMNATISSSTWGGEELRDCPVCRQTSGVEPSSPIGDAPCPFCGHLLWPSDRTWVAPVARETTRAVTVGRRVSGLAGVVRSVARRVKGAIARSQRPSRPLSAKPEPVVVMAQHSTGVWDPWLDS